MRSGVSVPEFCRSEADGAAVLSVVRLRVRFFGTVVFGDVDLGAFDLAGLLAVLRRRLPRSVPWFVSIHADMAAELALASSGMAMPFSCAIFSANDICAGLTGLGPGSPAASLPAFWGAC